MTDRRPQRPVVLVGSLDPSLSRHLIRAITEHMRWCRTNAIAVPPALNELLNVAVAARDGQQRPTVAPDPEASQGEAMLLTVDYETAARRLSVSDRTVRRLVAAGTLPAVTVGGCRRIRAADLDAYVAGLED